MKQAFEFEEEKIEGNFFNLKLVKRLAKYIAPYKWLVLLGVFLLLAMSLFSVAQPYIIKLVIDKSIAKGDLRLLRIYSLIFLGLLLGRFLLTFFQMYVGQYIGGRVNMDLRNELMRHLHKLDISFFGRNPAGRLITRFTSDINAIQDLFTSGFVALIGDAITFVAIVIILISMSLKLSAVTFTIIPPLVVISLILGVAMRKASRAVRRSLAKLNAYINERLNGVKEIQLFQTEKPTFAGFNDRNSEYFNSAKKAIITFSMFWPIMSILTATASSLVLWYGGGKIIQGALSIGTLVAFLSYVDMLFEPLMDMADKFSIFQTAMAAAEKVFGLMDEPIKILSKKESPSKVPAKFERLTFDKLSFSYDDKIMALKDINFTIKKGEKVAFVGFTGGGKTSIINLMV